MRSLGVCPHKRRRATKTRTSIHQMEHLNVYSRAKINLPRKKRSVYTMGGAVSNESDILGPITLEPWSTAWTLPFAMKKQLFGKNRREVGGTTDATEISDQEDDGDMDCDEGNVLIAQAFLRAGVTACGTMLDKCSKLAFPAPLEGPNAQC